MVYQVIYLQDEETGFPEQLGTKEKFWFKHGEQDWLFKFGRPGTGENWAEKAVCHLGKLLEIPCAQYELAEVVGRQGIASRSFVPEQGRLVLGNELLARFSKDYDPELRYSQRRHSVPNVMNYIRKAGAEPPPGWDQPDLDAVDVFLGYLLLDALVGNTDRHHENWGMLVQPGRVVRLAQTFDHASSLGRELSDSQRTERLHTKDARYSVSAYASKARSGFYGSSSGKQTLHCVDAFLSGAALAPQALPFWLNQLDAITRPALEEIFGAFPEEWISEAAIKFSIAAIEENLKRIVDETQTL